MGPFRRHFAINLIIYVTVLSHSKQSCNTRESHAGALFSNDEIDTGLCPVLDKLNSNDLSKVSIEDKARSMNPISDNSSQSDEIGEVHRDGIDASRSSNHENGARIAQRVSIKTCCPR